MRSALIRSLGPMRRSLARQYGSYAVEITRLQAQLFDCGRLGSYTIYRDFSG